MKSNRRIKSLIHKALGNALAVTISAIVCGNARALEDMPRGALLGTGIVGFDIEPNVHFGASLDGYLRLTKRFSLGLRAGFLGQVDKAHDPAVISQVPLAVLLSWDFILKGGRVLVPLTFGTGVSLLPTSSGGFFVDMLTVETGAKIRLSKKVWLALLVGTRAQYYFHGGPTLPYSDFRFAVGPYVRF